MAEFDPFISLWDAADLLAHRQISPVELTRAYLERIQNFDSKINSFITVTADAALQAARQAEVEIISGRLRGRLHGIPVALKDLFETAGVRTTHGSKLFSGYIPKTDGFVVQRLRHSGSIVLGKTNMHEIAFGVTNVNPHFGPCHNPWSLDRIPGGSSGGSGAAVAAGFCLGALGTDTGGSIRIPASLCGIVGLKPTRGRVSLNGVLPLSWNLDHVGPMARRVRDVAVLLQHIAGYDPDDPYSIRIEVDDYLAGLEGGVNGWRVGFPVDEYFSKADPEVLEVIRQAIEVFRQLGAQVTEMDFPEGYTAGVTNVRMIACDAAAYHQERMQMQPADFGADVLERLRGGEPHTAIEYSGYRREQTRLIRLAEQVFEEVDLLILPATAVTAPPIEGPDALEQARLLTRFTAPFNLLGFPALVLPCGFNAAGLPVGMQLVARPWAEAALLRAGNAYEQAAGWYTHRPLI